MRVALQESQDLQMILIKRETRQLKSAKRFEEKLQHPEAITIPLQGLTAEIFQYSID